jgi:hypothetical protein
MRNPRPFGVVILGLASVFVTADANSWSSGTRNLALYDQVGPYKVVPWRKGATQTQAEIRSFLWEHWQGHRRGCVTVTTYTKEGNAVTSSYYVEPDGQGTWKISVHWEREISYVGGGHGHESGDFDSYKVRRIWQRVIGGTEVPLPSKAKVSPEAYELVLTDNDGKERDIM